MIEINDTRLLKEFKSVTFSGYKRSDVKKHLLTQLFNANLEQSLNWTAELICCGAFMELWEIILLFLSKYIHLGNPKIPIYIELRFNNFKHIVTNGYIGNELQLRNNNKLEVSSVKSSVLSPNLLNVMGSILLKSTKMTIINLINSTLASLPPIPLSLPKSFVPMIIKKSLLLLMNSAII